MGKYDTFIREMVEEEIMRKNPPVSGMEGTEIGTATHEAVEKLREKLKDSREADAARWLAYEDIKEIAKGVTVDPEYLGRPDDWEPHDEESSPIFRKREDGIWARPATPDEVRRFSSPLHGPIGGTSIPDPLGKGSFKVTENAVQMPKWLLVAILRSMGGSMVLDRADLEAVHPESEIELITNRRPDGNDTWIIAVRGGDND